MKRRLILFIIAGVMTLAIPGCKNREAESPGSATEVMVLCQDLVQIKMRSSAC